MCFCRPVMTSPVCRYLRYIDDRAGDPVGVVGVRTPMGPWNLKNYGGPWWSHIKNYINTWAHQIVRICYINININKCKYKYKYISRATVASDPQQKSRSPKGPSNLCGHDGSGHLWSPGRSRDHSRFWGSVRVWSKSRSSKESSRLRAPVGSGRLEEPLPSKGPIRLRDSGGSGNLGRGEYPYCAPLSKNFSRARNMSQLNANSAWMQSLNIFLVKSTRTFRPRTTYILTFCVFQNPCKKRI